MTSLNWVTAVLVLIFVLSTAAGFRRRFAAESGFVVAKIISLVVGIIAF